PAPGVPLPRVGRLLPPLGLQRRDPAEDVLGEPRAVLWRAIRSVPPTRPFVLGPSPPDPPLGGPSSWPPGPRWWRPGTGFGPLVAGGEGAAWTLVARHPVRGWLRTAELASVE